MSKRIPKRLRFRAQELFEEIRRQFPACENAWDIIAFALHNNHSVAYRDSLSIETRAKIIVRNHVRHVKTSYEELLSAGIERDLARKRIQEEQRSELLLLKGLDYCKQDAETPNKKLKQHGGSA